MNKYSAIINVSDSAIEGLENFEAGDIVHAAEIAREYARSIGGVVVRVESCDFGAFEFIR